MEFRQAELNNAIVGYYMIAWSINPELTGCTTREEVLEKCICSLVENHDVLFEEFVKLNSIAPKQYQMPDGRKLVYHCPDELVPVVDLSAEPSEES